jgi:hypothetical protein
MAAMAALLLALPAAAAEKREPPTCAAIAFRPILSGLEDGVRDAGVYKSRFGRIVLKADVKNGVASGYVVEINGKPLTVVDPADLPKTAAECAKVKRLTAPAKTPATCTGDGLTVLITHSDDQRYFLLYGRTGGSWHFCSGGTA